MAEHIIHIKNNEIFFIILIIAAAFLLYVLIRYFLLPFIYNTLLISAGILPYAVIVYGYSHSDNLIAKWLDSYLWIKVIILIGFMGYALLTYKLLMYSFRNSSIKEPVFKVIKPKVLFILWIGFVTVYHFSLVSELLFRKSIFIDSVEFIYLAYILLLSVAAWIYGWYNARVILHRKRYRVYKGRPGIITLHRKAINILTKFNKLAGKISLKIRSLYETYYVKKYYYKNTLNQNYYDIQYSSEQRNAFDKLAEEANQKRYYAEEQLREAANLKQSLDEEIRRLKAEQENEYSKIYLTKTEYERVLKDLNLQVLETEKIRLKAEEATRRAEKAAKEAEENKNKYEAEANIAALRLQKLNNDAFLKFFETGIMDYDMALNILGLRSPFTTEQLKKCYMQSMKKNHPDRVDDMSEPLKKLAEERTKAINEANEYLRSYYN